MIINVCVAIYDLTESIARSYQQPSWFAKPICAFFITSEFIRIKSDHLVIAKLLPSHSYSNIVPPTLYVIFLLSSYKIWSRHS